MRARSRTLSPSTASPRTVTPSNPRQAGPARRGERHVLHDHSTTKDALLKNQKLREALSLAINRQAICDIVFDGTRGPADNIVPPGIAGYDKGAWKNAAYDVEAAKRRSPMPDTLRARVSRAIKLSFNSGAGHEKIMELVQADWEKIGVKSTFDSAEFAVYLKQLDAGKFQVARLGWIADYPIMDNFLFPLFTTGAGDNKSQYSNPEVDKGLETARAITDQRARLDGVPGAERDDRREPAGGADHVLQAPPRRLEPPERLHVRSVGHSGLRERLDHRRKRCQVSRERS